jgi:Peptidase A4 family
MYKSTDNHPFCLPAMVAALASGILAGPCLAQTTQASQDVPERGFTILPDIQNPIVLRTAPDAACYLRPTDASADAPALRVYANGEGYIRFHTSAPNSADIHIKVECTASGQVATYPLHLRSASTPTADMPMAEKSMPLPEGSRRLAALTDETAQQMSDEELSSAGYPPRPDPVASPEAYSIWLGLVAQPITLLPPRAVSRTDIGHRSRNTLEAGLAAEHDPNWSGIEAVHAPRSVMEVSGNWHVPNIVGVEVDHVGYSSMWVGLDGDENNDPDASDLVQAGTEQDSASAGPFVFFNYTSWTELVPNQPFEQQTALSINPGDYMQVMAWVCDADRHQDADGNNACFFVWDQTQGQAVKVQTPLSGTHFQGSEAEWIVERPTVNKTYPELANYDVAVMFGASDLSTKGSWIDAGKTANRNLSMYNRDYNYGDDDELATAQMWSIAPGQIQFNWKNYH